MAFVSSIFSLKGVVGKLGRLAQAACVPPLPLGLFFEVGGAVIFILKAVFNRKIALREHVLLFEGFLRLFLMGTY